MEWAALISWIVTAGGGFVLLDGGSDMEECASGSQDGGSVRRSS
jgi:hypothetical protein